MHTYIHTEKYKYTQRHTYIYMSVCVRVCARMNIWKLNFEGEKVSF